MIGADESVGGGIADSALRKIPDWPAGGSSSSVPFTACDATRRAVAPAEVRCATTEGACVVWPASSSRLGRDSLSRSRWSDAEYRTGRRAEIMPHFSLSRYPLIAPLALRWSDAGAVASIGVRLNHTGDHLFSHISASRSNIVTRD